MALLKCWIYSNEILFGNVPKVQEIHPVLGFSDEKFIFQQDLKKSCGYMVKEMNKVKEKFTDDIIMTLPKNNEIDIGNTLRNLYQQI